MWRSSEISLRQGRQSGGFALIIVLWTLVLIAFITAHLAGSGRTEIRIAGNLAANAVTDAAAEGAVFHAIFNLLDRRPERRWPLDGAAREFAIGDCGVTVRLHDETARINPNVASSALLEALLRVTGSDAPNARRLAASIGEWVGAAAMFRPPETLLAEYRAAGLDYGPPGEPLETVDELRRVIGMTPGIFAAIRPHLSLFAAAEPSLTQADPVVLAALAAIGRAGPAGSRPAPRQSEIVTARIAAIAQGPGKARARRAAIVRIMPRPGTYLVLAWDSDAE